jgi:cardiolipin synthase
MTVPRTVRTALHEVTVIGGAEDLYRTVFADLAAARRRILIECYIVSSDRMGHELYVALDAALKRGVEVQLLCDPLGSNRTDPSFFDDLTAAGVEVRQYSHLANLLAPRDHGRVVVIDDVAYTGGAAWGEQWLPTERGGRGWHDVCCRLVGPVVGDFARLFAQRFAEAVGERDVGDYDTGERYPDLRLVSDTPSRSHSLVYRHHEEAFRRARARIWIANAYFYPPVPMLDALFDAARRGVEVRVLLPGASDLPLVRRAARSQYRRWIAAGFRIGEYMATVMHGKYALVDDDWGTLGTFNANATAVGLSNEVNVFFSDRAAVAALEDQYRADLSRSRSILAEEAERRSLWRYVADELSAAVFDAANRLWGPR